MSSILKILRDGFLDFNLFIYFFQGDILFLHMSKDPIRAGEIVVFNVDVCGIGIMYCCISC